MDVISLGCNRNNQSNTSFDFSTADLLKCGSCSTEFLLSDILVFIQHKTKKCKIDRSSYEDKENSLKCSNCPESFGNASSLLEHAQFTHKIAIYLDNNSNNSNDSSEMSPKPSITTGPVNMTSGSSSKSSCSGTAVGSISTSSMMKSSSRNEIFIDVIPGLSPSGSPGGIGISQDSNSVGVTGGSGNNEYNITVSSSMPITSSSSSHHGAGSSGGGGGGGTSSKITYYTSSGRERSISEKSSSSTRRHIASGGGGGGPSSPTSSSSSRSRSRGLIIVDQNENTSSSTDSASSSTMTSSCKDSTNDALTQFNQSNSQGLNEDKNQSNRKQQKSSAVFSCNVCQAAFNQKIHLTKHSAKHTGIKPFKCTECNYSTVERSHLKVHVRVHTGEKPFKCTFCEYATAQSSTLKIHKKRHHDRPEQSRTCSTGTLTPTTPITPTLNQTTNSPMSLTEVEIKPKLDELIQMHSEKTEKIEIVNEQKSPVETMAITGATATVSSPPPLTPTSPPSATTTVIEQQEQQQRSSSFDIYRDKKNLPPTKRFKNYSHHDSSSASASASATSMLLPSQSRTSVDDHGRASTTTKSMLPNPDDEDRLVTDVEKSATNNESSSKTVDNKLLDLAKIALERETN